MGRAWTYGDNIDTDVIIATQHLGFQDENPTYENHILEPLDPDFADEVEPGDVVVAGRNFGSGSSREAAAKGFVFNKVDAVIAAEFARIFFRNAINVGLPVYTSQEAYENINDGDEISIDHEHGIIYNKTKNESYSSDKLPEFIQEIIDSGGLVAYHNNK